MTASLLPIPDDPRFAQWVELWPRVEAEWRPWPRSHWLMVYERLLREFYPSANADSLKLTARHAAPFYLRDGHDVP